MSKAYWIARAQIIDPLAYGEYARLAGEAGAKLFDGARILSRGGRVTVLEGAPAFERHVLIEFPDFDAAVRFHRSPEYQAAAAIRLAGAGINELVIVEGVDDSNGK